MEQYDVIIAGGGPIGCAVGRWCANAGRTVVIVEEHNAVGSPLHCAGLVTDRAFSLPDIPQDDLVLNTITGAEIHSPAGSTVAIGGDRTHALVIDRVRYDQALAEAAVHEGATLMTDAKITDARQTADNVSVDCDTQKIQGQVLVGADGARSTIRSLFHFTKPVEYLEGIGAEIKGVRLQPQTVLIYTGASVAPGFFAWVIPTNRQGTKARIGLCKSKGSHPSLQECYTALLNKPAIADAELVCRYGGLVPLGAVDPCVQSRVMLVGDAAAQVKPTSGGGIVTGLLCARQCARTINEAFAKQPLSPRTILRYQTRWKRVAGHELAWGMAFRRLYRRSSDSHLESWFKELQKPAVTAAITRNGDIDYPSRLLFPVLAAAPQLAVKVPRVLLTKRP